jgi:uncharacterized protein YbaP (TraB family)
VPRIDEGMNIYMKLKSGIHRTFFKFFLILGLVQPLLAEPPALPPPTEQPFLWKIEGKKISYLFGTIHVPDDRVLVLHPVVKEAAEASEAVYVEIPMEIGDFQLMEEGSRLPQGTTLAQVLPSELYKQLDGHLRSRGFPIEAFEHLNVWAIAVSLELLDSISSRLTRQAMDLFIYKQAKRKNKEVGGIETIKEQMDVFGSLTREEQVRMLQETLDAIQKAGAESPSEKLIQLYLKGDEEMLLQTLDQEMKKDDPLSKKIYQNLILDRNQRMADRVIAKLNENPDKTYFFAFGAAHMLGEDGLVKLLSKKGFRLERIIPTPTQSPDSNTTNVPTPVSPLTFPQL